MSSDLSHGSTCTHSQPCSQTHALHYGVVLAFAAAVAMQLQYALTVTCFMPTFVMGGRRPLSIAEVHHSRQSHERDPSDENTKISLVRWLYSSHQHHSATSEIEGVLCVVVLVVRIATTALAVHLQSLLIYTPPS